MYVLCNLIFAIFAPSGWSQLSTSNFAVVKPNWAHFETPMERGQAHNSLFSRCVYYVWCVGRVLICPSNVKDLLFLGHFVGLWTDRGVWGSLCALDECLLTMGQCSSMYLFGLSNRAFWGVSLTDLQGVWWVVLRPQCLSPWIGLFSFGGGTPPFEL